MMRERILPDDSPIFLVGFMGAGKTSVGRALAQNLNYEFLDLDELIEAQTGKSVRALFGELGEAEFRRLESEAIASWVGLKRAVIALGGGAYVSEENRARLRSIGRTVWLDCPLEVCLRRVGDDESRPLLGDEDEMRKLFEGRRVAYARADYVVATGEGSPQEISRVIISMLASQPRSG